MLYSNVRTKFHWGEAFWGWGGVMLFLLFIILTFGILNIYSASFNYKTNSYSTYAHKQTVFAVASCIPFILILRIDYTWLLRHAYYIYAVGVFLLVATVFFGTYRNESKRWINLGFIMLQTSEVMKLAIIPLLARIFSQERKNTFWELIPPFILAFIPMGIIMTQPDLGTSLVFLPLVFVISFIAGVKVRYHVYIIVGMLIVAVVGYFYGLHDYQRKRVLMFLRQEKMTKEEKQGSGYHISQSKIAFGNGGFWGQGWQKGSQNRYRYLPENHTDFVFGVVGEEFGFVGTAGLITFYIILFIVMLKLASNVLVPGGQYMVIGVTTLLITHTLINTSMTIGLMPVVGIPLPFFSYGGSALMFNFIGIALVFSIAGRRIEQNND